MIIFDPEETVLFNVGINIFSGIIAVIILNSYRRNFAKTYDIRLLLRINTEILLILLADIIMLVLNGGSGSLINTLDYLDITFYFIMQIAVALGWLRYTHYRIFGRDIARKEETLFVRIPFLCLSILVVTAPFNGWCFYLDDANYYHRGVLSLPMSIIILAYLLSVSVIALAQYKKEVLSDRRKELLTIAFFAIPPLIGGAAQTAFYGLSMIWPCTIISSLLILTDKESQAMS